MDTDLLKNFTVVAHFLNMTKAAEFRNISPSAVSKKISALEYEMGGATLMQRYPGRLYLTKEGEIFLKHAQKILEDLEGIKGLMNGPTQATSGPFCIHSMRSLGVSWLSAQMSEFRGRYPQIELDVLFDGLRSFAVASQNSGVYAGLSTNEPVGDSIYIWKKMASYYLYPYAHQSYLDAMGVPTTLKQLDDHKILHCHYTGQLTYEHESQVNCLKYMGAALLRPAEMNVDEPVALKTLIENGAGIGMLPSYMGESSGLVRLLDGVYDPQKHSKEFPLYYVYPSFIKSYQRIIVFKDFIQERLQNTPSFHHVSNG